MMNFPPKDEKELFDILQFIKKSPFAENYWNQLKALYKQAELAIIQNDETINRKYALNILYNLIYRIDQERIEGLTSKYPTQATLRYMKRRAKRFVRHLYKNSPDEYFEFVSKIIYSNIEKKKLDLDNQWIMVDILFGHSKRFKQKSPGYGPFTLNKVHHLNHREEYAPEIWDKHINFLADLLNHTFPWEVYEFATKILYHNKLEIPKTDFKVLKLFFQSPSPWLKYLATHATYQVYTFQGVPADIYAGMWLYGSHQLLQKVIDIDQKRPKKDSTWYGTFANVFGNLIFEELKAGNNSYRIEKALKFLYREYPDHIPEADYLPLAPTLLQSNVTIFNELALTAARKAKPEEAVAWIKALGLEVNPINKAKYNALVHIFLPKIGKKNSHFDYEKLIFQPSYFVCDFGWLICKGINSWRLYKIWTKLFRYGSRARTKEVYFLNSISSDAGSEMFKQFCEHYSYGVNYMPTEATQLALDKGSMLVRNLVKKYIVEQFKQYPWNALQKFALLPDRDIQLSSLMDYFAKNNTFQHYYWYLQSFMHTAGQDEWMVKTVLKIINVSQLNQDSIKRFIDTMVGNPFWFDKGVDFIFNQANPELKNRLIQLFSERTDLLLSNASKIPEQVIQNMFKGMNTLQLMTLIRDANAESWENIRNLCFQKIKEKENEAGFWKSIFESILANNHPNLNKRLLENPEIERIFMEQEDETVMDLHEPEFEHLLLKWAERHATLFRQDNGMLFKVCLHKLPSLRNFAYRLMTQMNIEPVFALQLMESKLPEAMQAAMNFFNQLAPLSEKELETALILVDSPSKEVRAYGMEFLGKRKENFKDQTAVLEFLSEHSDGLVQTYVAKEINRFQKTEDKAFVQRFDKEILRMKNKNRKAKEIIKERLEKTLEIKPEVLLEMSRSGTKKDMEWAIVQLTKKAISEEGEMDGFEII